MKKILLTSSALFFVVALAGTPFLAHGRPQIDIKNVSDFVSKVLCPIFKVLFTIFMIVAVIMIVWAAYLYLTSSGEPEKISAANRMLVYVIAAIVIGLLARSVPPVVASILEVDRAVSVCPGLF